MKDQLIFETERLLIRYLKYSDLNSFHTLQSNPKVMQYVDGEVKSLDAHRNELTKLINLYSQKKNDYWIYAIVRKFDASFVGTLAFVKDENNDDEIGIRFLEEYWRKGYGSEVCRELIFVAKKNNIKKLVAYVFDQNIHSVKILTHLNFTIVSKKIDPVSQRKETKYELIL